MKTELSFSNPSLLSARLYDAFRQTRLTAMIVMIYLLLVFAITFIYSGAGGYNVMRNMISATFYIIFKVELVFIFIWCVFIYFKTTLVSLFSNHQFYSLFVDNFRSFIFNFNAIFRFIFVNFWLFLFTSGFVVFKVQISKIHPYVFDDFFSRLDFLLHFHRQPWQWLLPLLQSHQFFTRAIFLFYNAFWMFSIILYQFWLSISSKQQLADRCMLVYVLLWIILGSLCATIFSSVGPLFLELLHNNSPQPIVDAYSPLVQVLRNSNVNELFVLRDSMWSSLVNSQFTIFGGISAMPSLHVAISTLYVLTGLQLKRWYLLVTLPYLVLVLLGSIVLGWHYAVDGYVSIIFTCLIWKFSKKLV